MQVSAAIDIGNSRIKAGIFREGTLAKTVVADSPEVLFSFLGQEAVKRVVVATVGHKNPIVEKLCAQFKTVCFSVSDDLPITLNYHTPHTLGVDRIAGIMGAWHLKPLSPSLVIDLGTCITYDFIDGKGVYQGGAISPGANMRLKAMHQYTASLPEVSLASFEQPEGKSTTECMLSGVYQGIKSELNGYINYYKKESKQQLDIYVTGGDAPLFSPTIPTNSIYEPNLVLFGLHAAFSHYETV